MSKATLKYGSPAEKEKPHIKEFYCAMHNGIPVHKWGASPLAPVDIDELYPMQIMTIKVGGEKSTVNMMVCKRCIVRMRKQLAASLKLPEEQIKAILKKMREDGEKGME